MLKLANSFCERKIPEIMIHEESYHNNPRKRDEDENVSGSLQKKM